MQYGEVLFREQKTVSVADCQYNRCHYNRRPLYVAEVCTQIFHLLYSRRLAAHARAGNVISGVPSSFASIYE